MVSFAILHWIPALASLGRDTRSFWRSKVQAMAETSRNG